MDTPDDPVRRGQKVLRALIAERRDRAGSSEGVLETRLLALLRRSRLPLPTQQHALTIGGVGRVRVDFAYPDRMVAIETDGYRWHAGKRRWARDLDRRNALTAAGWRLLHVTWDDVEHDPAGTVERIAALVAAPVSRDVL